MDPDGRQIRVRQHTWSGPGSRVTIEQATGAPARIRGASVDEAFARLRDHSRRTTSG